MKICWVNCGYYVVNSPAPPTHNVPWQVLAPVVRSAKELKVIADEHDDACPRPRPLFLRLPWRSAFLNLTTLRLYLPPWVPAPVHLVLTEQLFMGLAGSASIKKPPKLHTLILTPLSDTDSALYTVLDEALCALELQLELEVDATTYAFILPFFPWLEASGAAPLPAQITPAPIELAPAVTPAISFTTICWCEMIPFLTIRVRLVFRVLPPFLPSTCIRAVHMPAPLSLLASPSTPSHPLHSHCPAHTPPFPPSLLPFLPTYNLSPLPTYIPLLLTPPYMTSPILTPSMSSPSILPPLLDRLLHHRHHDLRHHLRHRHDAPPERDGIDDSRSDWDGDRDDCSVDFR
ncbi:hypothetical protein DFH08DRAFT_964296 [Mycena albidolilacea]|uniref:Uncharacterized protein n=1 Tax=Mycena albidolilacea TaxID=1033008 RepID=A0AAD6ZTW9_9AGAR|nr:hypothetical protein DFH08DRAFT_964296 [Mycena albidolilacea]